VHTAYVPKHVSITTSIDSWYTHSFGVVLDYSFSLVQPLIVNVIYNRLTSTLSVTQESLSDLFNKLGRKSNADYHADSEQLKVEPGWLKYEYNDSIWNLDDGAFLCFEG
jgi:hypothetical protein